ncbi:MAG: hypothetical protein ACYSP9_05845 [Planctomycetota bacterium]|jgi:hypothetical protein
MTVGDKGYKDLAVPLHGESEIRQVTAATDILTITRITAGTGDFIAFRDDGGTEVLAISKDGRIQWKTSVTTPPTTSLTKGQMFIVWSNSSPDLALCTSTAGNTIKYLGKFDTKTLGRASA